jgi:hypothetical protein
MLSGIIFITQFTFGQQKSVSFIPDTSVNNIKLNDYVSTEKVLGAKAWEKNFEANNLFPRIEIVNQNKKQILRLLFHYGGSKNSVDEFEILAIDKSYKFPKQTIAMSTRSFKTSRDITLFTKKSKVIKMLGSKYKVLNKRGDYEQVHFEIGNPSNFLKRYNQYKYYISCTFKKGFLIKYSFGFEYP